MSASAFPVLAPPLSVDLDLVRKYDRPVPRYTSYPTAAQFRDYAGPGDLLRHLEADNRSGEAPLSLYVHLPFCESLCWFCGCTTVITRDRGMGARYLDYLEREIALLAPRVHPGRRVVQLHFGGGTPTFFGAEQLTRLVRTLRGHFTFAPDAELSVEIDPRRVSAAQVDALAAGGFTRASLGVQDFNPEVQLAIHRIQPRAQTEQAIAWLRAAGFTSINLDLIYGLPRQTVATFADTLAQVRELAPDRLAVFSYAHVPWMKPAQKILEQRTGLPTAEAKLEMFKLGVETLTGAGYACIGLDHFARPDDELAVALAAGTLQRNFQGYSTRAGAEILGFGLSAISQTTRSYRQNHKDLAAYYAALDAGLAPFARGLELTAEDERRRAIIMRLMCRLELDFGALGREFGLDFRAAYAAELARLRAFAADGLVEFHAPGVRVTETGRLLLRNLAACFDAQLAATAGRHAQAV
jgi:oxygen-independent coproporphyrinogen-3 oxidase